jgi:hypothetical protein
MRETPGAIAIVRGRCSGALADGAVAISQTLTAPTAIPAFSASASIQSALAAPATAVTLLGNTRVRATLTTKSALLGVATLTRRGSHAALIGKGMPRRLTVGGRFAAAGVRIETVRSYRRLGPGGSSL